MNIYIYMKNIDYIHSQVLSFSTARLGSLCFLGPGLELCMIRHECTCMMIAERSRSQRQNGCKTRQSKKKRKSYSVFLKLQNKRML